MAVGADFDRSTGTVFLVPGSEAIIGFVLDDDDGQLCQDSHPRPGHRRRALSLADGTAGSAWSLLMTSRRQAHPRGMRSTTRSTGAFAGKVVRKDLVRKVKVGANVPVFVLEFLLGKYCASSDPARDRDGAAGRQRHAGQELHPAG